MVKDLKVFGRKTPVHKEKAIAMLTAGMWLQGRAESTAVPTRNPQTQECGALLLRVDWSVSKTD
eukprot:4554809-Pleurochrysis_carterae.AAC.1